MSGISGEWYALCTAVLTGAGLVAAYELLTVLRMLFSHRPWLRQLEDFIFWVAAGFAVFLQMFRTNNGSIRWYFALGTALGASLCGGFFAPLNKSLKKGIKSLKKRRQEHRIKLSK